MGRTNRFRRRPSRASRPLTVWLYLVGALFLAFSALSGGAVLMLKRADDPLGMPLEWLADTPFPDYFVPGATLFSLFGVGSVVTIYGVLRRRSWAWLAAVGLGLSHVGWILVQVALLRIVTPLHVLYGGLGAVLSTLASTPSFRAYLFGAAEDDGRETVDWEIAGL